MRLSTFIFVLALVTPLSALAQTPAPECPPASPTDSGGMPTASAAQTSAVSFGSLFTDLRRDLFHLPSTSNALALAIGGGLALAAHPGDHAFTAQVIGSERLDDVFEAGAAGGSGWMQIGGALGTYVLGRSVGSAPVQSVGAALVRAQVLNTLMTQGIKVAVHRTRPDEGRFSFPSGHASGTFATASVLQRQFGWRVGLPAYGLAAYVAGSRVQEDRHYASDVIFGAAVGIVAGRTVSIQRGGRRFEVTPAVIPGGAAIVFTRTG
ncbi:MAG TPA: phosphatase PAP2 family protein [Vicinamibacterales bacterium]|nr:phosphatase PAP2 family protein [Vicinamibacterales bacterium]